MFEFLSDLLNFCWISFFSIGVRLLKNEPSCCSLKVFNDFNFVLGVGIVEIEKRVVLKSHINQFFRMQQFKKKSEVCRGKPPFQCKKFHKRLLGISLKIDYCELKIFVVFFFKFNVLIWQK